MRHELSDLHLPFEISSKADVVSLIKMMEKLFTSPYHKLEKITFIT